jgi:hypothetical protein
VSDQIASGAGESAKSRQARRLDAPSIAKKFLQVNEFIENNPAHHPPMRRERSRSPAMHRPTAAGDVLTRGR